MGGVEKNIIFKGRERERERAWLVLSLTNHRLIAQLLRHNKFII